VALEDARHREFTELVSHHVLGHVHRDVLLAVVHGHRQPDEVRDDVERLDQVLIGRLSFEPRAASTFFIRWWSTKGPFLIERAIFCLSYARRRSRTIMTCVRLLRRVL